MRGLLDPLRAQGLGATAHYVRSAQGVEIKGMAVELRAGRRWGGAYPEIVKAAGGS